MARINRLKNFKVRMLSFTFYRLVSSFVLNRKIGTKLEKRNSIFEPKKKLSIKRAKNGKKFIKLKDGAANR